MDISKTDILKTDANQEMRFRCPCCEKLYRTHADTLTEIDMETKKDPEFDCEICENTFALTSKINSFGLFETKAINHNFSNCPKCTNLMPLNAKECPTCGIFIDKYQKISQSESPTLFAINQLWEAVLLDFNIDQNHQNFLNFCQKKLALNFAFQKYSDLRKSMSFDLLCEKYLKQIEIRLEQQFIAKIREDIVPKESKILRIQWVFASIGFLGLGLLIFNKIRPTFPNLTGLVVAVTLLSFGIWFFTSEKKDITQIKL